MPDIQDIEGLADEELVKMTLQNKEFFLHLVNRYKMKLFFYIRRITNVRPEDAEDLLQEVFLKVYLNLNDFNPDLKFSSWVYRIAHNQVISSHRKLKARPEGYSLSIDSDAMKQLADQTDIVRIADQEILRETMTNIFSKMKEKYREVLILKYIEEKSYEEISDILKKPMGTVASLINKAKKEMKRQVTHST